MIKEYDEKRIKNLIKQYTKKLSYDPLPDIMAGRTNKQMSPLEEEDILRELWKVLNEVFNK